MHFNQILPLIAIMLFGIAHAQGLSFFDKNVVMRDLEQAEQALNQKIERCNSLKQRPLVIQDSWLLKQAEIEKETVLFALYVLAQKRCTFEEEKAYQNALLEFTAQTGDKSHLNEWLNLRKYDPPSQDMAAVLKNIPLQELQRLSALPEFYFPFDLMNVSESKD